MTDRWRVIAALVGALCLFMLGASVVYGARMRGVADAHIELARQDSVLKDSLTVVATGLRALADDRQADLVAQAREADVQRVRDSLALAELRDTQDEARVATLAAIEDLPPEVMEIVRPVFELYEIRIRNLERQVSTVEGQRDQADERAVSATITATSWMETALGYERALEVGDAENANLRAAIEALNRATSSPSFGIRIKLGWWIFPAGVAVGYALGGGR